MQRPAGGRHPRIRQDYDSEFIVGPNGINFKHAMLQTFRAAASHDANMHPRGRLAGVHEIKDVLTDIANLEHNGTAAAHVFY